MTIILTTTHIESLNSKPAQEAGAAQGLRGLRQGCKKLRKDLRSIGRFAGFS